MVDTLVLGTSAARRIGSSPIVGTKVRENVFPAIRPFSRDVFTDFLLLSSSNGRAASLHGADGGSIPSESTLILDH